MSSTSVIDSRQVSSERHLAGAPRIFFALFSSSILLFMLLAWWHKDSRYLQAESGLGYVLGIVGVAMMTLLLLYPLRKRVRVFWRWGNVSTWFRIHMILGVLGPCCILLHSNFRLGSTNSTVALMAMLLVASSGLLGRYFYGKFHYGVYGEQVKLAQIREDLNRLLNSGTFQLPDAASRARLEEVYQGSCQIIESQQGAVSVKKLLSQRRWLRKQKRWISRAARHEPQLQKNLKVLGGLLNRLAGLRLFERLFGLWHVLHIPVFLLMVVTAVVHIFVVHRY